MNSIMKFKPIKNPPLSVFVNSDLRQPGSISATDFNYSFVLPENNTFSKMIVSYACIPKSFYNVSDPYNTVTVTEKGIPYIITMIVGNYTRLNFATNLMSVLNANSLANGNNYIYNITIPSKSLPETGKYTYTVSGNGTDQPKFSFTYNSLYEQMGFPFNSTYQFISNSLVAPNVTYLQLERTLFINCDAVDNPNNHVLQEIYSNNTQTFSSIVFTQFEYYLNAKPFKNTSSNIFNFRLTDEKDTIINLVGLSWNFSLIFY